MFKKYSNKVLYFYAHNKHYLWIYTEKEIWELDKLNQKSKNILNRNNSFITFTFLIREAMLGT